MVLGTSEVEIAYNTYRDDPTEAHLKAFIRSKPRDHEDKIAKEVYFEAIRDSKLSWDKQLNKRLFEKPNRVLIQLCQDNFINHLSRNNKSQLVNKLVTHFQEKPGEWELQFSDKKYEISKIQDKDQTDQTPDQTKCLITNGSNRSNSDESNKMLDHNNNEKDLTERKGIRIPQTLVSVWKPQQIRDYIDSKEYGSDRVYDLPSDLLHEPTKSMTIWLTISQFLIEKYTQPGRPTHPKIINRQLQSKIDELKFYKEKSYDLALMFSHLLKNNQEVKKAVLEYKEKFPEGYQGVENLIKRLKGGK